MLTGCAANQQARSWQVVRIGQDLHVRPPAVQKTVKVRDCSGQRSVAPTSVERARLLQAEDEGCLKVGTAQQQLRNAIERSELGTAEAARLLHGGAGSWVELQPGWRLRVITPLLKSGGYRLKSSDAQQDPGNTLTIRGADEFLGMETTWYHVQARTSQPGVRIQTGRVERVVEGQSQLAEKPAATLFPLPDDARRIRLLYLTRVSSADHDMLVVSGRTYRELEELTAVIRMSPADACKSTPYCSAVPAGIAVRTEMPVLVDGREQWVPAGATAGELKAVALERKWRGKLMPVEGAIQGVHLLEGDVVRTQ